MLTLNLNLLYTVVNILVLFLLLRKFLYKPVMNIIAQRQKQVDDALNAAETSKQEAAAALNDAQAKLHNVDAEAAARRTAYEQQAEKDKQQLLADAQKQADAILAEGKAAAEAEAKPIRPEEPKPPAPKQVKSEQGIIVEGLDNCLVKFSKCCSPVPGDEIVGFITRGYGVSVHRKDCPHADPARRPPEEAGRWIKVSWGGKTRESYRTNLQVVSKDRPNLLVDISTILSAAKVHVSSLNARSTADGFALISLAVDVSDSQQLQAVMRRLEQISGVMRVTRPAG